MMGVKKFVLWGSASHAKCLARIIALCDGEVVALFDENPEAQSVLAGVPLYVGEAGFAQWIHRQDDQIFYGLAAIGGTRGRHRLAVHKRFRDYGVQIEPLVHPQASVCSTALLGDGTQVFSQAVVGPEATVGEETIINHGAVVDHECVLGRGVNIAPGATLCGCVRLADNVMIGANATVLPHISIGENTVVGAGTVVIRDLPDGVVAVGNPARIIKKV